MAPIPVDVTAPRPALEVFAPWQGKTAAVSGFLFVALSIVFPFVGGVFPAVNGTSADVAAYYDAHREGFLWGNWLAMVAGPFSFALLAHLAMRVRAAEPKTGWWWLVVLGSGLVLHAVGAVDLFIFQAAGLDAGAAQPLMGKLLHDLATTGFGFFLIAQFGSQLGTGLALLTVRSGFSRGLGYSSLAGAVFSLVASLGTVWSTGALSAGGVWTAAAFGVFILWSLWLSVECWRTA